MNKDTTPEEFEQVFGPLRIRTSTLTDYGSQNNVQKKDLSNLVAHARALAEVFEKEEYAHNTVPRALPGRN